MVIGRSPGIHQSVPWLRHEFFLEQFGFSSSDSCRADKGQIFCLNLWVPNVCVMCAFDQEYYSRTCLILVYH